MNLLEMIRMRNIFGVPEPMIGNDLPSQGGIMGNMQMDGNIPVTAGLPTNPPADEKGDVMDILDIYNPETKMTERMARLLENIPQRNKPGVGRRIVAALVGGGREGIKGADEVLFAPYHRQLEDWENQFKPTVQAANQERYHNVNMRQIAANIINQDRLERSLQRQYERDATLKAQGEERLRQGDERISQGDYRLKQGDERIKIAKEVAKGGVFEVDDSGNARIVRKDGTVIPVDGSYLSYEQKEELKAASAARITKAREGAKRDRVALRPVAQPDGSVIYEAINLDEAIATPVTSRTEPKSTRPVPQSELEQGRDVTNRAMQVKNTNAEWSKYIVFDKSGRFKEIKRPSMFPGYPDQATYDKISQAIYGTSEPNKSQKQATIPPEGKIRVRRKSDGATGTILLKDYDPKKYDKI